MLSRVEETEIFLIESVAEHKMFLAKHAVGIVELELKISLDFLDEGALLSVECDFEFDIVEALAACEVHVGDMVVQVGHTHWYWHEGEISAAIHGVEAGVIKVFCIGETNQGK